MKILLKFKNKHVCFGTERRLLYPAHTCTVHSNAQITSDVLRRTTFLTSASHMYFHERKPIRKSLCHAGTYANKSRQRRRTIHKVFSKGGVDVAFSAISHPKCHCCHNAQHSNHGKCPKFFSRFGSYLLIHVQRILDSASFDNTVESVHISSCPLMAPIPIQGLDIQRFANDILNLIAASSIFKVGCKGPLTNAPLKTVPWSIV